MHSAQTVSEMVEGVLTRQAKALVERSGQSFQSALKAVSTTDAGRQLRELASGEHRKEAARDWQVGLALKRAEERYCSRLEGYLEWLEGKEARTEFTHAWRNSLASEGEPLGRGILTY